jgi:tetratricopeptide (TPR) repeat protein
VYFSARAGQAERARGEARPYFDRGKNQLEAARMRTSKERRARRREDLESAAREFTEALRIFPDYADAALGRAQARLYLGRTAEALDDVTLAVEKDAKLSDAYFLRILLRYQIEQERLTMGFESFLGLPQEPLKFQPQVVDQMRADLARLRELNAAPALALTAEGTVLMCEGKKPEADAAFDRAVTENPLMPEPHEFRAYLLSKDDQRRSVEELDEAIRLDPNVSRYYVARALLLLRLDQKTEAGKDAEEIVQIAPDEAISYLQRGFIRLTLNDRPGSAADFEKARQMNPLEPFALFIWVLTDLHAPGKVTPQNAPEYLTILERAIAAAPSSGMLHLAHGLVRVKIGQSGDADFARFLELQPAGLRKDMRHQLEIFKERITGKKTTALLVEDAEAVLALKMVKEARGMYAAALQQLDDPKIVESEKIDPERLARMKQTAAYNLACCHALLDEVDAGFEMLERAFKEGFNKFDHARTDLDLQLLRQEEARFEELLDRFEKGF